MRKFVCMLVTQSRQNVWTDRDEICFFSRTMTSDLRAGEAAGTS